MSDKQQDWRQKSQARGLKVVSLVTPLFLISLYLSAQLDRRPPRVLKSFDLSGSTRASAVLRPQGQQASDVALRFLLTVGPKPVGQARLRYRFADAGTNKVLRQGVLRMLPISDRQFQLQSNIIHLPIQAAGWRLQVSLGLPKNQNVPPSSLQLSLQENPPRPSEQLYRFGDMLLYPSFAVLVLGLVMIFGPRMIHSP